MSKAKLILEKFNKLKISAVTEEDSTETKIAELEVKKSEIEDQINA